MDKKIAIIGGGAAGLFTAYLLSKHNLDITLFEKNNKLGKKLLATGNGRCNITNESISNDNFYSNNLEFISYTLKQFDYNICKKIFNEIGIEFTKGEKNRVYPNSLNSSSVVELLKYQLEINGVNIVLNYDVKTLESKDDKFIINETSSFDIVVISTGSIAMAKLGSCDSGYKLSSTFGHTTTPLFPSLVQLVCDDSDISLASGVKIEVKIGNIFGDLLFTKYGVSGSAILDISRDISQDLLYKDKVNIKIDLLPQFSKEKLVSFLLKRAEQHPAKPLDLFFDGFINIKLARFIISKVKLSHNIKKSGNLTRKDIQNIVYNLKNLNLNITSTKGFENCEVVAGGIDTYEIDNKTMESKLKKDLYIIGEVVDIDGQCGGYNLHWAWASGYVASKSILKGKL